MEFIDWFTAMRVIGICIILCTLGAWAVVRSL